jgi:hypothetical protein
LVVAVVVAAAIVEQVESRVAQHVGILLVLLALIRYFKLVEGAGEATVAVAPAVS